MAGESKIFISRIQILEFRTASLDYNCPLLVPGTAILDQSSAILGLSAVVRDPSFASLDFNFAPFEGKFENLASVYDELDKEY